MTDDLVARLRGEGFEAEARRVRLEMIARELREEGLEDEAASIVTDTWPDLKAELDIALANGEDWRARGLAKQWRTECFEALSPGLLNAPHDEAA